MLLHIHPEDPNPRQIKTVLECLNDGGIIIYPTDTIYGIGCDIFKQKTVQRVAQIKGLKKEEANFSFICYDLSQIADFTRPIPNNIFKLMKATLPGPYTFILNANNSVPKLFQSKKKTVGIRVPDNKVARTLVHELGHPILSSSVHDDDDIIEYTTDPELIYEKYQNQVDLVIDSGFGGNIPSSIIDCTHDNPIVLREGKGKTAQYILPE